MAGDTLRDAFRARLAEHRVTAGISLAIKDVVNTIDNPDASAGFLDLEFPGSSPERQYTFGAPGQNLHLEQGQVTLRVCMPLGAARDVAEAAAEALRTLFRGDRFPVGASHPIRIRSTGAMGDGITEGGMWAESVALGYEAYHVG